MKDARAVTRQVLSIAASTTPEAVMSLRLPDVSVLWAARHGNKLRLGHLKGNRFAIKIRDAEPTNVLKLRPVVDELTRRGMPNYFGEQRFGRRGDNDVLGAALVRGDDGGLLAQLLGRPDRENDHPRVTDARAAYDAGELDRALDLWPGGMERAVLARLVKTNKPEAAVRSIDQKIRKLWVSALQSRLFNDVVARRIDSLGRLMPGDLAYKHANGACFRVEDASAEQPRADAFEISPTGPLLGSRMTEPTGEPLGIEREIFTRYGLSARDFRSPELGRVRGARRPLRVKPEAVELAAGVDQFGAHITVAFTLPAGSFATVLVGELTKSDATTSD
jgi:tRNA pseudouridine13 synthase